MDDNENTWEYREDLLCEYPNELIISLIENFYTKNTATLNKSSDMDTKELSSSVIKQPPPIQKEIAAVTPTPITTTQAPPQTKHKHEETSTNARKAQEVAQNKTNSTQPKAKKSNEKNKYSNEKLQATAHTTEKSHAKENENREKNKSANKNAANQRETTAVSASSLTERRSIERDRQGKELEKENEIKEKLAEINKSKHTLEYKSQVIKSPLLGRVIPTESPTNSPSETKRLTSVMRNFSNRTDDPKKINQKQTSVISHFPQTQQRMKENETSSSAVGTQNSKITGAKPTKKRKSDDKTAPLENNVAPASKRQKVQAEKDRNLVIIPDEDEHQTERNYICGICKLREFVNKTNNKKNSKTQMKTKVVPDKICISCYTAFHSACLPAELRDLIPLKCESCVIFLFFQFL